MTTLSSLKNNRLFVILMGKPLIGKSVLASQFPSPWFVDLDFGLSSVNAIKNRLKLDFDFDVTQIDEEETKDADFIKLAGMAFARQNGWRKVKKLTSVLTRKMPQDSTLVIDGLSRIGEMLKKHITTLTGKSMRIQDWETFAQEMCDFCDDLNSPNAVPNVILVAHENIIKDEITGAIERVLLIAGKSAQRLPSLCGEYWRLSQVMSRGSGAAKRSTRTLETDGDWMTNTGSRSWMPSIENPTYEKIRPYL